MNEPIPNEEVLNAARAKVAEGLAMYADGWSVTEGGIVVSFVCLFEVQTAERDPALVEICGSGSDGSDPLPRWRREGMLWNTLYGDRITH